MKMHILSKFIEKTPSSATSRFTVYRWITSNFTENNNQLNNQLSNQLSNQLNNHKSDDRLKKRDKEDHPSIPSSEKKVYRNGMTDDLFSKEQNKNKIHVHSGNYHNGDSFEVYLSQQELDSCIKSRGSIERVRDVIDQVARWPNRQHEIKDWIKTILNWKFKSFVADRSAENEKLGKQIEDLYGESFGWNARVYRDPMKDIRGVLFESSASTGNSIPIFVPFSEASFKEKCLEVIKSKNMKKKGEK
jgi:hypothetical protein